MPRLSQRTLQIAISGLLAGILGIQTAASFGYFRGLGWRWPFLDYPMYTDPYMKGDAIPVLGLVGLCEDRAPIPITAGDLNLDYWEFLRGPIAAAERGDSLSLKAIIKPYAKRKGIPLTAVQLFRTRYVLSDHGVDQKADEVVTNFDCILTP